MRMPVAAPYSSIAIAPNAEQLGRKPHRSGLMRETAAWYARIVPCMASFTGEVSTGAVTLPGCANGFGPRMSLSWATTERENKQASKVKKNSRGRKTNPRG